LKRDPDRFFSCAIEWDPITGIIKLDSSKYLRKIIAKYDMTDVHSPTIPLSAGNQIYTNEEWKGDNFFRNLYQQISGSLNYAAQL